MQQEDVQLSTFGRKLSGEKDALPKFEPSLVRIEDPRVVARLGRTHHDNVTFNGNSKSRVTGTVFEVSDEELASADRFELAFFYRRVPVTLESGKQAWVYVDAQSATA
jgi:hypothetical protein